MVQAVASKMMSMIAEYRNPQGSDDNWFYHREVRQTFPSGTKLLEAEVGFALNAVIALIETIASFCFCQIALFFAVVDRRSVDFGIEWLRSASFTVFWSSADLICNFFFCNLLTQERTARGYISHITMY